MRIDLTQLALSDTRLTLPPAAGHAQHVHIARAEGVHGVLLVESSELRVSHAGADALELGSAALRFGPVALGFGPPVKLQRPKLELRKHGAQLTLDLSAEQAELGAFTLHVGALRLDARLMLRAVRFHLGAELGRIEAGYAELSDLTLTVDGKAVRAPHVVAHELVVGWGGSAGFTLAAASARALDVAIEAAHAQVHGSGLELEGLRVRGGNVSVRKARVERVRGTAKSTGTGTTTTAGTGTKWIDWGVMEGASGKVRADVHVDLSISVLPRRAVHRIRLDVDEGSIDYRALEHGLSRLEDALLDFVVRDGALVLELGVPLIPMRGHGKPLVTWPLGADDLARAEQAHRVRLSVLARPEPRVDDDDGGELRPSQVRLHALDALDVDVALSLPVREYAGFVLRRAGASRLRIEGELHLREHGGAEPGRLDLEADTLELALAALPIGASALSIEALDVGSLHGQLGLTGLRPSALELELSDLALDKLSLGAAGAHGA